MLSSPRFQIPNYKPSPQPKRISGLNGALPTAYDDGWQLFTDLSPEQIAAYQAMPEWQNFLDYVALSPKTATTATPAAVVNGALQTVQPLI